MASQDFIDQTFLDEVANRYPNSDVKGDLAAAKKKYPQMYKSVMKRVNEQGTQGPGWQNFLRTKYGWLVDLYDEIPQFKGIIDQAVSQGWTADRFQNAIRSTDWWRATDKRVRNFTDLSVSDPATLETEIGKQRDSIRAAIQKAGYSLGEDAIGDLAQRAFKFGWTDLQLSKFVGSEIARSGTAGTSGASLTGGPDAEKVRNLATSFGIRLDDSDVNRYVKDLLGQTMSDEQLRVNLKMDASNMYPSLKAQFDAGRTFNDITAPYRKLAADYLEIDPQTIDFTDSKKWGQLLSYADPKSGESRMMTGSEWASFLRMQPEWQQTSAAKSVYRAAASKLIRAFGKVVG